MSRAWRALWVLLALAVPSARAHTPDTSYVRVAIARDKVELRFTLDVFTIEKITEADADHDQRLTREELRRAGPAIERFLRDHVRLELDSQPAALGKAGPPLWPRDAGEALPQADWHANESLIAMNFTQPLAHPAHDVAILFNVFEAFGERHVVLGSFLYEGRSEEVTFTQPEPDYLFDTQYSDVPHPTPRPPLGPALFRFFRLGMEHIFFGPDHLCFLIAFIVVGRLRELVKIITSFTVAHSITLILAGLQIARLPPRFVECAIAATIVYVAAENLFRQTWSRRWLLTFGFGLIHGFGFANTLLGMGLPAVGRVRCLLVFNAGVEVAQLGIIVAVWPLLHMLDEWRQARAIRAAVSVAVGCFGLCWLIERAFGVALMPR